MDVPKRRTPTYDVEEFTREGMHEDQEMLRVTKTKRVEARGFDGEITTQAQEITVAEVPKTNAFEVAKAIAEWAGYKLVGR